MRACPQAGRTAAWFSNKHAQKRNGSHTGHVAEQVLKASPIVVQMMRVQYPFYPTGCRGTPDQKGVVK